MPSDIDLPPQPFTLCFAEVRVARDDLRLFVLAAGAGVERWCQIWGAPSGSRWLSWQSLHALGPVTVLHGLSPAPVAVAAGGRRMWPHVPSDGTARKRWLSVEHLRQAGVVHVVSDRGVTHLTPEHARELAATLVELAGWVEASDDVAQIMTTARTPAVDAMQRALDRRG